MQITPLAGLLLQLAILQPIIPLLGLFLFCLLAWFLSYHRGAQIFLSKGWGPIERLRSFFATLTLFVLASIAFWATDIYFINLPDPILPISLYVLVMSIYFGLKATVAVAVVASFIGEYYLFEPRYRVFSPETAFSVLLNTVGVLASLLIGNKIYEYQRRLLKNTEDLRSLIRARDQFASIAAHDLKNPLTTIKLYAQSIDQRYSKQDATNRIHGSISIIDRETDKLLDMVNRLLDLSKIEEDRYVLNKEQLDLNKLCRERIESMRLIYPNHKFCLKTRGPHILLNADQVALDRILTNLLTNAAKYSPPRSKVEMEIRKNKKSVHITVKDQGWGFKKEELEKLYQPFYQTDSRNQGLGLGLYISKRLIELHGGKIQVKTRYGKGSRFIVSLPTAQLYHLRAPGN